MLLALVTVPCVITILPTAVVVVAVVTVPPVTAAKPVKSSATVNVNAGLASP